MTDNWKIGDLALVTLVEPGFNERRGPGPHLMVRDMSGVKDVWRLAMSGIVHEEREVADARPLVVIDPESREQVEQLARAYEATWTGASSAESTIGIITRQLQEALRELANPTPSWQRWTDGDAVVSTVSPKNVALRLNDEWRWSCTQVRLVDSDVDRLLVEGKATLLRRQTAEDVTA